jgi:hypothetical protein
LAQIAWVDELAAEMHLNELGVGARDEAIGEVR